MYNAETVRESQAYTVFLNIEIQTEYQFPTRIPDLVWILKKEKKLSPRCFGGPQNENKIK